MKEAKVSFTSGSTTVISRSRWNQDGPGFGIFHAQQGRAPGSGTVKPLAHHQVHCASPGILVPGVMALPLKLLFQYRSFHEIGLVDRILSLKVTSVEYI